MQTDRQTYRNKYTRTDIPTKRQMDELTNDGAKKSTSKKIDK